MDHAMIWGQFLVAAALIIFCGVKLTRYGDIYSERLGLGHAFIGAVLIGWSTSLPEFVISIGTAVYAEAPALTMGNVLGSNLFNIFIIVLIDLCYWRNPILRRVESRITQTVILSLVMVLLVGVSLFIHTPAIELGFFNIGYDALAILAAYFICMGVLFVVEQSISKTVMESSYKDVSLPMLFVKTMLVVAIIVGAGLWLSTIATQIQQTYQLEEAFVGSFFLAVVSSLPEVITVFIAVRLGFHAMAVGALFGSNIFNMTIIAVCDIFYLDDTIFNAVYEHRFEYLPAVILISLMTLITLFVLKFRKGKEVRFFGFETISIGMCYVAALAFSYDPSILEPLWQLLRGLL